jgi:hypothetical protein
MQRKVEKKDLAFAIGAAILASALAPPWAAEAQAATDSFGIEEIYDGKDEDMEWHMEDDDPESSDGDSQFSFGTRDNIEDLDEVADGVWRMDVTTGSQKHGVRMHVEGPDDEWQDVEMTGYFKLLDSDDEITMIARHGESYHDEDGCEALGYYGMINSDGDAYFKKKLYHGDGGYSDKVGVEEGAIGELEDEWVGVKFAVYNEGDDEVKLELWADEGDEDNDWEKIAEYTDDGDLEISGDGDCDRSRDHVIDEAQYRVSYRLDDSEFEFKDLSVREIDP